MPDGWTRIILALPLACAGCAIPLSQAGGDTARPPQSISYETGPCFGACPVYRFTIDADGNGSFEGVRFTKVLGARTFTASREAFRAFATHLAPLRPGRGTVRYDAPPTCDILVTDRPSTSVTWKNADGPKQSLYFYYGCDMDKNRAMAERLSGAPELLPVMAFIKE